MKASIVIPSFNAFERLNYNLLSLSLQNCSKELFEVIVVDNCSTDKTRELIGKYQDILNIKRIYLPINESRSRARNVGIAEASGDIIIFSDTDMISERDYVAKHIEAHTGMKDVICGVNWEKVYTFYYKNFTGYLRRNFSKMEHLYHLSGPISKISDKSCLIDEQEIMSGSYKKYAFTYTYIDYGYQEILKRYGNDLKDYHFPWSFFVTNNCSVRKEMIIKAGMFDENYIGWGCEDLDLGYRLYKNGCSFRKENIESIHQEHPINVSEDGLKNIYFFSEKYNTEDVLLYYFHHLIPMDIYTANELVKEIEYLTQLDEYQSVVNIFRGLLKAARDSNYRTLVHHSDPINDLKKIKKWIDDNREQFASLCRDLTTKHQCHRFSAALKSLEKKMLRVS